MNESEEIVKNLVPRLLTILHGSFTKDIIYRDFTRYLKWWRNLNQDTSNCQEKGVGRWKSGKIQENPQKILECVFKIFLKEKFLQKM